MNKGKKPESKWHKVKTTTEKKRAGKGLAARRRKRKVYSNSTLLNHEGPRRTTNGKGRR